MVHVYWMYKQVQGNIWEMCIQYICVGETCVGVFVTGDSIGIHLRKVYDTCTRVYAYVIYFT